MTTFLISVQREDQDHGFSSGSDQERAGEYNVELMNRILFGLTRVRDTREVWPRVWSGRITGRMSRSLGQPSPVRLRCHAGAPRPRPVSGPLSILNIDLHRGTYSSLYTNTALCIACPLHRLHHKSSDLINFCFWIHDMTPRLKLAMLRRLSDLPSMNGRFFYH